MSESNELPPLAQAALARFADRFDPEQRAHLIELARELEAAAGDLCAFELDNGDEPDAPFTAIQQQDTWW